jgi:hypothetical protein
MDYRHATPIGPEGNVVHGPFPVRLARLALALVALLVGPLFLAMALDDAALDCDRPSDRCHYRGSHLFERTVTFPLSRLRGVRVDIQVGSKGHRSGVPVLDLSDHEQPLATVELDEAQRFARALEQALTEKRARFALDLQATRAFVVPGVLLLVLAASAFFAALRGIGRVVLVARGAELHLTRRVFGVPLRRDAFDLRGVTDVEVDWERRTSFFTPKHSPGDTYGRLVLVRGAEREPLTEGRFPGYHLHRRAERALRDLLALPPRSPEREQALASAATGYQPPPILGGGVGAIIGLTWIGLCSGALLSLPLAFLVLFPLGLAGREPSPAVFGVGVPCGAVLGVVIAFALRHRAATR